VKSRKPTTKAQRQKACAIQRERNARIRDEMAAMPHQTDREVERKLGLLRFVISQLEEARAAVLNARNADEQAALAKSLVAYEREVARCRVDLGLPRVAQEGRRR